MSERLNAEEHVMADTDDPTALRLIFPFSLQRGGGRLILGSGDRAKAIRIPS
jgi:hypothetical protein